MVRKDFAIATMWHSKRALEPAVTTVKVYWRCLKCRHMWIARSRRKPGHQRECPRCRSHRVDTTSEKAFWAERRKFAVPPDRVFTCPYCGHKWSGLLFSPQMCPKCHNRIKTKGSP